MLRKLIRFFTSKRVLFIMFSVSLAIFSTALNIGHAGFSGVEVREMANIKVFGMKYEMKIDGVSSTTIKAGAKKTTMASVSITSLNDIDSKYELIYKVCISSACVNFKEVPPGFEVKYASSTVDPVTDKIHATSSKLVKIAIINNTAFDIYIELDINAGFSHNTLDLVGAITDEYAEADLIINLPDNPSGVYNMNTGTKGVIWDDKINGLVISSETKSGVIVDLINADATKFVNLASYIKTLGNAGGVYNEPATDYRYEGKNPNNYIWFNNELWRIIGTFASNTHGRAGENLVKIIRAYPIGSLVWHKENINNWPVSSLYRLLNEYYYNGINEAVANYCYQYYLTTKLIEGNCDFTKNGIKDLSRGMIENVTWRLGGIGSAASAPNMYNAERGTIVVSGRPTETTGNIGLMYPSDYGYSVLAASCARTTSLENYITGACAGAAWLYGIGYERTIMPSSSNSVAAWAIYNDGKAFSANVLFGMNIRPVLYLKANTKKISGDGTPKNPYIISL